MILRRLYIRICEAHENRREIARVFLWVS